MCSKWKVPMFFEESIIVEKYPHLFVLIMRFRSKIFYSKMYKDILKISFKKLLVESIIINVKLNTFNLKVNTNSYS